MDSVISVKKNAVTAIENHVLDALIAAHDADAALVYLYVLKQTESFRPDEACGALSLSPQRLSHAVDVLSSIGLLDGGETGDKPLPAREEIDYKDIAKSRSIDIAFRGLCDFYEGCIGRVMRKSEILSLYAVYSELTLPPEVIMLLIKSLSTPPRRLSGRELEREAALWCDQEIDAYEKAEAYLTHMEKMKNKIADTLGVLKIYGRAPSPTEEKHITAWLEMGFAPDVIEHAYDKTIINTGGLKWNYLNKILANWHEKGLLTLAAIEKSDKPTAKKNSAPVKVSAPGDYEQSAIERTKSYLRKKRGGS